MEVKTVQRHIGRHSGVPSVTEKTSVMKREKAPASTEAADRAIVLARAELTSASGKLTSVLTELRRAPPQVEAGWPCCLSVDVEQMLVELRAETARLDAAILSLERPVSPARIDVGRC
jgi:hypothetical protein